jgi:hypothetical protein
LQDIIKGRIVDVRIITELKLALASIARPTYGKTKEMLKLNTFRSCLKIEIVLLGGSL